VPRAMSISVPLRLGASEISTPKWKFLTLS
jgi:hypothetical protein